MTAKAEKVWRDYDQAALDVQYNSRGTVPDFTVYTALYKEQTLAAKADLRCIENVDYGLGSDEQLDIYPASVGNAPVMVFLHGGNWQAFSKEDNGFGAPTFTAEGITFVVPDFTLVPRATVVQMGAQVGRMLAWVWHHIGDYGGDTSRIFIAGHSSGANLVSQLLSTEWATEQGVPRDIVKGAVFISGLGDLEPVRLSFRNQNLQLDPATVTCASLLHCKPTAGANCPLLVAVGEDETDDYKRQARDVAAYWEAHGNQAEFFELSGRHHFDSVLEWVDPQSALFRATLKMMGLTPFNTPFGECPKLEMLHPSLVQRATAAWKALNP